jgi:hypothetical protein
MEIPQYTTDPISRFWPKDQEELRADHRDRGRNNNPLRRAHGPGDRGAQGRAIAVFPFIASANSRMAPPNSSVSKK